MYTIDQKNCSKSDYHLDNKTFDYLLVQHILFDLLIFHKALNLF